MSEAIYRAVAILQARQGREQELLDFALSSLPAIRRVEGLQKVELTRSLSDTGQLVLYYWWETPEHSKRYVASAVYAQIAPRLEALVGEHTVIIGAMVSG